MKLFMELLEEKFTKKPNNDLSTNTNFSLSLSHITFYTTCNLELSLDLVPGSDQSRSSPQARMTRSARKLTLYGRLRPKDTIL